MNEMERKMLKEWLWKVSSDVAILADILDGVFPEGYNPDKETKTDEAKALKSTAKAEAIDAPAGKKSQDKPGRSRKATESPGAENSAEVSGKPVEASVKPAEVSGKSTEASAKKAEAASPSVALETVRGKLAALIADGFRAEVKALLAARGLKQLSEATEQDLQALWEEAQLLQQ